MRLKLLEALTEPQHRLAGRLYYSRRHTCLKALDPSLKAPILGSAKAWSNPTCFNAVGHWGHIQLPMQPTHIWQWHWMADERFFTLTGRPPIIPDAAGSLIFTKFTAQGGLRTRTSRPEMPEVPEVSEADESLYCIMARPLKAALWA